MIWLRRLAWCAGAVLLLEIVAWLAVPPLLAWQLPIRASEALGRQVTLGKATFHPWNLDLALHDLVIAGPPGAADPLLQVSLVHADLAASSLFRLAPVIEGLEIDGLRLRVARLDDGHYDVDDLIARFKPRPNTQTPDATAHFALYNVQLRDAQVRFDDRPVRRVQLIEALHLTLPFISNLPAQVQIKVEPRLSFKLDGTPFDTGAQATPFAQTRNGDMKLSFVGLDLTPFLGYLPAALPVRVVRGRLSADLAVNFSLPAAGAPQVKVKGTVGAGDLAMTDQAGMPLLSWQHLQLDIREVEPIARRLELASVGIEGLQLHANRDATGRINLLQLTAAREAPVTAKGGAASAASAPAAAKLRPWSVQLDRLSVADARILWNDAAVQPAAALQLDRLSVAAQQVHWPLVKPVQVTFKGALHAQAASGPALAEFSGQGPVTEHDAKLALELSGVSLAGFAPYWAQALVPSVGGQLATRAVIDWSGAADSPRLRLALASLALDNLEMREPGAKAGQSTLAVKQLALADVQVDLLARTVSLGTVKLAQPVVDVVLDKAGKLNLQGWLAGAGAPPSAASVAPSLVGAPAPSTWQVQLKDLVVDSGQVHYTDVAKHGQASEPVRLEVAKLQVVLQGLQWQGDHTMAPATLQLSARVGGFGGERPGPAGTIDYQGRIGLQPLLAIGNLRVDRFPVQLLGPYFAHKVQLTLLRAEAGYKGSIDLRQSPAGIDLKANGDVLLGDVHVATLPEPGIAASVDNTDELLSWQALALKGVTVAMAPRARPRIVVGAADLSDFYSRLVVTEQGRFNLQEVAAARPDAPAAGAASAPIAASAPAAGLAQGSTLPVDIQVGTTRLTNGRIDYTDHFIRPNYSAALTELNGQLGSFSSDSHAMASLELHGRAAGTALLAISGSINPIARPLALDIHAKATDLELAPLSPYAGKYVGYAIERGKLTMELAYKIDPDGRLDATNQVVLNQLTFGDKIESKDAIKLPLLLAVALLKDRNGVIDVNLPISGSLNDPQFSVGGIIFKLIGNLLTKAITSPFSLLFGGGGGGEELSQVDFKPGTAQLEPSGATAIDKVAKALADRPALKMTVTGAADLSTEHDAFQTATLEQRLADQQRQESLRAGTPAAPASAPSSAPEPLRADARAKLLKQIYQDADLPNKPRNPLGFAKDIPAPEMEALLKTRMPVTEDAMRTLAQQRGLAVRDALIAKGLPSERLFLAAPRLVGVEEKAWTPRVQLALTVN